MISNCLFSHYNNIPFRKTRERVHLLFFKMEYIPDNYNPKILTLSLVPNREISLVSRNRGNKYPPIPRLKTNPFSASEEYRHIELKKEGLFSSLCFVLLTLFGLKSLSYASKNELVKGLKNVP